MKTKVNYIYRIGETGEYNGITETQIGFYIDPPTSWRRPKRRLPTGSSPFYDGNLPVKLHLKDYPGPFDACHHKGPWPD